VDGIERLKKDDTGRNMMQIGGTARRPEDVWELHRMGLQFVEIPVADPDLFEQHIVDYQKALEETGVASLCHGPREGDPNNVDTLETVYLPKLLKTLSIMPQLNMRLLTIHLWVDPRFVSPDIIAHKVEFLKRLLNRADASGIRVCIENLSENATHLSRIFEVLPSLNLTLDLGHAQLLTAQNTSFGFMERFPERVQHIHLHDNLGGTSVKDDLHLPVGKGIIDFDGIFKKLSLIGYNRTMTLELRPEEIRENLDTVTKRLADSGFRV
jgi:sugar phosphate isomerase/epimerase